MSETQDGKNRATLSVHDEIDPNSQIVAKLKTFYEAVEQEPIPDIFLDLLDRLASVEAAEKPASS